MLYHVFIGVFIYFCLKGLILPVVRHPIIPYLFCGDYIHNPSIQILDRVTQIFSTGKKLYTTQLFAYKTQSMSSKHSLPHFVCTVLIHTRHFIFHRKTDEYRRKCVICVCVFMLFRGILVHSNNDLIPSNILRGSFQMNQILQMSFSFVGLKESANSLQVL